MVITKLEDITSKEFLDRSLQNAKTWCESNLSKHLKGLKNGFDYSLFRYIIDNDLIGPDMTFDMNGLIKVSTEKLKWYQQREEYFKKDKIYNKIRKPVEVDPESIFVHEITEFILYRAELFDLTTYLSNYFGRIHETAREIENINRIERDLKRWPEF